MKLELAAIYNRLAMYELPLSSNQLPRFVHIERKLTVLFYASQFRKARGQLAIW